MISTRSSLHHLIILLSGLGLVLVASAQQQAQSPDQEHALAIYRTIVGMRTAAGYGQVPAMAAYLAGELKKAGFRDDDIHILPHEKTAALVVRYRGDGSAGKKPILFLAHMDVVDAESDDWSHPPFDLQQDNEYFLGRGVADNKYGVMNLIQTFIRLKASGFVPSRDLILAFSGDEETTQGTTAMLVSQHRDLVDAEFALNSDSGGGTLAEDGGPLAYTLQSAEKTYATFEITARNRGGHSARPRRDNAIYELAEAILRIRDHRFPVKSSAILSASLRAEGEQLGGELGAALIAFANDPTDHNAINRILANEEYDHVISTTCVSTMLRGGQVENALPQAATVTVNCRIFPGTPVSEIQQTLRQVIANDQLEMRPLGEYAASPASPLREDVIAAVSSAVHKRYPGVKLVPSMSSGYTDAVFYRRAGIPTYGVSAGFMRPGVENAHGVNERYPVKTFFDGLDHWTHIIHALAGHD